MPLPIANSVPGTATNIETYATSKTGRKSGNATANSKSDAGTNASTSP
jgi:hypothetical protein